MALLSTTKRRTKWRQLVALGGASTGLLAGLLAVAASCASPTEIRLEVETDVPFDAKHTLAFYTNDEADPRTVASATWSDTPASAVHPIGSMIVVPEGETDAHVDVRVVMGLSGKDPRTCVPGAVDAQCIIARRSLSFRPRRTTVVPIGLHQICRGVDCPSGQTCNGRGQCVSATIDPNTCDDSGLIAGAGCRIEGDAPIPLVPDASPDAPAVIPDATPDAPGKREPVRLASGLDRPRSIGVDGSFVYWTTTGSVNATSAPKVDGGPSCVPAIGGSGAVWRAPKDGSAPATKLADMPTAYGLYVPPAADDLFVTSLGSLDTLYANGSLYRTPKAGCGGADASCSTSIACVPLPVETLQPPSGSTIYWLGGGGFGSVNRATATTPISNSQQLAALQSAPHGLSVDDQVIAWITENDQGIRVLGVDAGGAPTKIGGDKGAALVLDKNEIFYVALTGTATFAVRSITRDGNTVHTFSNEIGAPGGVAIDGTWVYFTVPQAGLVRRARRDGTGEPETIATGQGGASAIVVDASGVYWLDAFENDGKIGSAWSLGL